MTRRSRREIERTLEDLADENAEDDDAEIVVRDTVVGTEWEGSGAEPGSVEEEQTVIEL